MKTRPSGSSMRKFRNASPQAKWKKLGTDPRIFPCVPLPEPGAPNNNTVRYFICSISTILFGSRSGKQAFPSMKVFVPDLHFGQFCIGDHHVVGSPGLHYVHIDLVWR